MALGSLSQRERDGEGGGRGRGRGGGGAGRDWEDAVDWDQMTIKGTCQKVEKKYLRLTSAPDPSTVRAWTQCKTCALHCQI